MATVLTAYDKLEFCAQSANTPLTIEAMFPIGKHSVGIEGWWCPDDGDIDALLELAFRRYFHRVTLSVNLASEDMGYYRFGAKLTERPL